MSLRIDKIEHEAVSSFKQHAQQLPLLEAMKVLADVSNHVYQHAALTELERVIAAAESACSTVDKQAAFGKVTSLAALIGVNVTVTSASDTNRVEEAS